MILKHTTIERAQSRLVFVWRFSFSMKLLSCIGTGITTQIGQLLTVLLQTPTDRKHWEDYNAKALRITKVLILQSNAKHSIGKELHKQHNYRKEFSSSFLFVNVAKKKKKEFSALPLDVYVFFGMSELVRCINLIFFFFLSTEPELTEGGSK